jgi:hypothetical protein
MKRIEILLLAVALTTSVVGCKKKASPEATSGANGAPAMGAAGEPLPVSRSTPSGGTPATTGATTTGGTGDVNKPHAGMNSKTPPGPNAGKTGG